MDMHKSSFAGNGKITPDKLAALLAKVRAARTAPPVPTKEPEVQELEKENTIEGIGIHGEAITYNKEQLEFITLATSKASCIMVGAAGTGKTTCTRGAILELIQNGTAGILHAHGHKHLAEEGTPGIVAVSFTRRAVTNLRKAMPAEMKNNCITIHKLLEYQPVYYTVIDPDGNEKQTMRFEATRTKHKPLPDSIRTVIIDESSMVSTELFKELQDALPHSPQFIFLGDIQQLPPVFGSAILGFKMLELPTVELTQVYRQALESPIIRLAHRILSGNTIPHQEFTEWKTPEKLTIHPWKKKLSSDLALATLAKFFTTAIAAGQYDPEQDMILIPFNKACGTEELNKHISQYLARSTGKEIYEIIAGFNKIYLHVGAKVLYDREDAIVTTIAINGTYLGKRPMHHSLTLDYWGHDSARKQTEEDLSEDAVDFLLDQAAAMTGKDEERVRQASHIVTLQMLDSDTEITIDTASALNSLLLGYALTVHKAQGSEWRKVFFCLHQSHATMIQRELLYTAVTRAREELYCICEPDSFEKGIRAQRIKGDTLAAKAIYFQGRLDANGGTY